MNDNYAKNENGKTVPLGTVIHSTLRPQDLLPEFVSVALEIDHERTLKRLRDILPNTQPLIYDDDHPWWESEACSEAVNAAFDLLDEYAPEGYVFGAHPGDGSDFGFWPDYSDYYAESVLS